MKHPRPQRAARLICPSFWVLFCEHFLGADVRLAKELWSRLYPSADLLYQLVRIEDSGRCHDAIMRFGALLPPAVLLAACERLAPPEGGKPRRRDVVALEEAILARTDNQGKWV